MTTMTAKKNGKPRTKDEAKDPFVEKILEDLDLQDRMVQHAVNEFIEGFSN
jgi:hypothetical protein